MYYIQFARNATHRHLDRSMHAANGLAFHCTVHEKWQSWIYAFPDINTGELVVRYWNTKQALSGLQPRKIFSYLPPVKNALGLTLWCRIFFLILAHPAYKMWITQEPKKVALWNKQHFEERKNGVCSMFKIFCTYIFWIIYKMQHLEVSGAVRHIYIYIYVIQELRVNVDSILVDLWIMCQ